MRLRERVAPLLVELRGNRRLQYGVAAITLLLLLWVWLVLADWREGLAQEIQQTEERLLRVRGLADQDIWLERAAEARALRDALAAEIPPADSPGLAQAAFQSWLQRLLESQGAQPQLAMESPLRLDTPPGIVRVGATLSGSLPSAQVLELIRRIEGERQLVVIPSLLIRSDLSETFSLTIHAYYRLGRDDGSTTGVTP